MKLKSWINQALSQFVQYVSLVFGIAIGSIGMLLMSRILLSPALTSNEIGISIFKAAPYLGILLSLLYWWRFSSQTRIGEEDLEVKERVSLDVNLIKRECLNGIAIGIFARSCIVLLIRVLFVLTYP